LKAEESAGISGQLIDAPTSALASNFILDKKEMLGNGNEYIPKVNSHYIEHAATFTIENFA